MIAALPAAVSAALVVLTLVAVAAAVTLAVANRDLRRRLADTESTRNARVREDRERIRALTQHSSEMILVVGDDLVVLDESPSAERVLGYRHEDITGSRVLDIVHPDDASGLLAVLVDAVQRPEVANRLECRLRRSDGSWRDTEVTVTVPAQAGGGVVLSARDVTEQRVHEERLAHQALHDSVTGLPNRALFKDRVEHALDRQSPDCAVIMLDLDGFKAVNDSLGHAVGDELLALVGQRLCSVVSAGTSVARLGGDEFAVLVEDVEPGRAAELATAMRTAMAPPFAVADREVFLNVSLGIAEQGAGTTTADDLIRNANVAMHLAKARGRDDHVLFDPAMHADVLDQLDLQADLRRALERDQFVLRFQPIVDLEDGTVCGVETLVRWQHPERGIVGAASFIPLAEQTGLIVPLGRWVLREACRQMQAWSEEVPDHDLVITVNLSSRQLQDPALTREVAEVLEESGIDPTRLVLEITESTLMEDIETAIVRLDELRALGLRLALDDFGTGYSSLSYLDRLPVDILKVDASFVRGVGGDAEGSRMTRTILDLGKTFDLQVLAEGIERPEQAVGLRRLGCRFGQGRLFAGALEARAVIAVVAGSGRAGTAGGTGGGSLMAPVAGSGDGDGGGTGAPPHPAGTGAAPLGGAPGPNTGHSGGAVGVPRG